MPPAVGQTFIVLYVVYLYIVFGCFLFECIGIFLVDVYGDGLHV